VINRRNIQHIIFVSLIWLLINIIDWQLPASEMHDYLRKNLSRDIGTSVLRLSFKARRVTGFHFPSHAVLYTFYDSNLQESNQGGFLSSHPLRHPAISFIIQDNGFILFNKFTSSAAGSWDRSFNLCLRFIPNIHSAADIRCVSITYARASILWC
jgi:hypothetical protein